MKCNYIYDTLNDRIIFLISTFASQRDNVIVYLQADIICHF